MVYNRAIYNHLRVGGLEFNPPHFHFLLVRISVFFWLGGVDCSGQYLSLVRAQLSKALQSLFLRGDASAFGSGCRSFRSSSYASWDG